METMLVVIGVGCVIGAIVRGRVKISSFEIGELPSLWRQFVLLVFGAGLILLGLNLRKENEANGFAAANVGTADASEADSAADAGPAEAVPVEGGGAGERAQAGTGQ